MEEKELPAGKRALVYIALALLYLLARLAALVPVLLPRLTAFLPLSEKPALILRLSLCAVLFLLFVWPERVFSRAVLTRVVSGKPIRFSYLSAIKLGCRRLLRALPLLLPFLLLAGLSFYLFWFSDFTSLKILKGIAGFFGFKAGKPYDVGAALVLIPTLLLLPALMIRWHLDFPYDYIENRRLARGLTKRAEYKKLGLVNFLLSLPPLFACAAVILPAVVRNVTLGKGMLELVTSANNAIRAPLNTEQQMLLLLIFLLLYLPLYFFRKTRAAALCAERGPNRAA